MTEYKDITTEILDCVYIDNAQEIFESIVNYTLKQIFDFQYVSLHTIDTMTKTIINASQRKEI